MQLFRIDDLLEESSHCAHERERRTLVLPDRRELARQILRLATLAAAEHAELERRGRRGPDAAV